MELNVNKILQKLDYMLSINDYTSAKTHLKEVLKEAEKTEDERAKLLVYNELMGLCRKLGEEGNALGYTRKALLQIQKMHIEENIGAATTYLNCATVYKAFGKGYEAMPLFEKAEAIYNKSLKPNDTRFGGLYNNMALALVDLKRFREAECYYKKAISVMEKNENKEPEQAITYLNMASAAEAEFGLETADEKIKEYLEAAAALLDKGKNRNDGEYAFVCEKCASVFGYYGYFLYEEELTNRKRRIYERA